MRFEKARDAFNHASLFHTQLSKLYQRSAAQKNTDKAKLLLNYLVKHEQELADGLDRYQQDAPAALLDTWFQYTNDTDILKIPESAAFFANKSIETIAEFSFNIADELIKFYEDMALQADKTTLKEAFTNLAAMQKQEKRKLSMNIDRLMDL